MKKQKVFVLIKHGADNQDYSGVNVIGVYSTKTAAKDRMAEEEDNILNFYKEEYPDNYEVSEDKDESSWSCSCKDSIMFDELLITESELDNMNKQEFIFVFPQSGETITKKMNPLAVKDAAVKYLKMQNEVRGDICIIKNAHEDVVAMAYVSEMMKVSFFTEDESVNDIKPIGVIEEGGKQ